VRRAADGARSAADDVRRAAGNVRGAAEGVRRPADNVRKAADGVRKAADGEKQGADNVRRDADGLPGAADDVRGAAHHVRLAAASTCAPDFQDILNGSEQERPRLDSSVLSVCSCLSLFLLPPSSSGDRPEFPEFPGARISGTGNAGSAHQARLAPDSTCTPDFKTF